MDILLQDIKSGFRVFVKSPGMALASVLTLALALGANTAMFGVVDAVLIRPLPYPDSNRLVSIRGSMPSIGAEVLPMSAPEFADVRDRTHAFESVAAYATTGATVTGDGEPERVTAAYASASLMPTLGVAPVVGRSFSEDEDRDGFDKVAVIGYGLWQRRFGGAPSVVGRTIQFNGVPYTIVGAMPASFRFPSRDVDIWVPIAFTTEQYSDDERGSHFLGVLARLRPNVGAQQAETELRDLASAVGRDHTAVYQNGDWMLTAKSLKAATVGDAKPVLLVLLAAVGLILLIACVNVANLMLSRATARRTEIAVRAALGASRWRIVRQLLTEGIVLSLVGGALGVLLAVWLDAAVASLQPVRIPRYEEVGVDARVLAFGVAVSIVTGLLFALVPALVGTGRRMSDILSSGSRGVGDGAAAGGLRGVLVVGQVALAVVVLVGAGLLVRSLGHLLDVPPGFDANGLTTMRVSLPQATYGAAARQRAFFDDLLARVSEAPGVKSVGAVNYLPLSDSTNRRNFAIDGVGNVALNVEFRMISAHYFDTMRMRLDSGRFLDERDREGAPFTTVVNESMARTFFPGRNPIGRRIKLGDLDGPFPWMEIVGVAGDVHHHGLDEGAPPEMYVSYRQPLLADFGVSSLYVVVRSDDAGSDVAGSVRAAIGAIDPTLPVFDVRTMTARLDSSLSGRWFDTLSLSVLGLVALLLSAVGIYGVLSYSVSRRVREIGVRMALGARPSSILSAVLERGALLVLLGLALGLALSIALSRFVASLLFDVAPTDALTFAAVSGLLVVVAFAACYFPARRATRVDPLVALRCE